MAVLVGPRGRPIQAMAFLCVMISTFESCAHVQAASARWQTMRCQHCIVALVSVFVLSLPKAPTLHEVIMF